MRHEAPTGAGTFQGSRREASSGEAGDMGAAGHQAGATAGLSWRGNESMSGRLREPQTVFCFNGCLRGGARRPGARRKSGRKRWGGSAEKAGSREASAGDMLPLERVLLAALLLQGDNAQAIQEHLVFTIIQISSFVNQSWVQHRGSGWLGDMQTHGWDTDSGTIIFLHTWSKGNFSDEELLDLEMLFRVYLIGLTREAQEYVSQLHFTYPFEIQVVAGCELHSSDFSKGFLRSAYEGSDFVTFQNMSLVPSPGADSKAQSVCYLINQYEGIKEIVYRLITNTCPRFVLGLFDAAKVDYKRQVRPEAWLSTGPAPGPGRLRLVCHVSGFHPKPVQVTWMRGEQEQQGTQRGDILPHADGTWYLRVTLDVAAREAAGLSCRVKHSSLGGQDIVLYWGHHVPMYLILLAVTVPLVLLIVLALWFRKRCSYQDIP
ncbi:T-cell surface glycoprotein CD1c-like [Lycaon pictus]